MRSTFPVSFSNRCKQTVNNILGKMFSMLLEKEPSEEDIPEEEEEEEEEEEAGPDEETIIKNEDITSCFALFDKNHTGSFDSKYLEKALKCLGIFLTDFEIEDLRETMSKDGEIPFDNFYKFTFEKLSTSDPHESLKVDFLTFDTEREGFLPRDRFKKWMTTLGDPLTEKEVKELIKLGDPLNTGMINYNDLIVTLNKK